MNNINKMDPGVEYRLLLLVPAIDVKAAITTTGSPLYNL
jgi:hypothetical protein